MQETDLISAQIIPVGLIFDEVLLSGKNCDINRLAKLYVSQAHFQREREIIPFLHHRYDEITNTSSKKNWARFCIKIIFKKDFEPEGNWEEEVDRLISKFEELPYFDKELEELKKGKEGSIERYRIREYLEWMLKESTLSHGLMAHSWFFDTSVFFKEMIIYVGNVPEMAPPIARALSVMWRLEPRLFTHPTYRKHVRQIALKAQDEELLEKLNNSSQQNSPREENPSWKELLRERTEEVLFSETLKRYLAAEDVKESLCMIAKDLYHINADLLRGCTIADLHHPNYGETGVKRCSRQVTGLEQFTVNTIKETKGVINRTNAICFFIELASACFTASDHLSTLTILMAIELNVREKKKYKLAWENVDERLKKIFEVILNRTFSPNSNFKLLKKKHADYDTLNQPYVPLLNFFLLPLAAIDESYENYEEGKINLKKVGMLGKVLEGFIKNQDRLPANMPLRTNIDRLIHTKKNGQ